MLLIDENVTRHGNVDEDIAEMQGYLTVLVEKLNYIITELDERLQALEEAE